MASVSKALSLLGSSVSRPTLYSINLGLPSDNSLVNVDELRINNEYISMFARMASIPEVAIDTEQVLGQDDQGVMRLTPIATKFVGNVFSLNIIENSNFTTYKFFKELMQNTGQVKGTNPRGSNNYSQRTGDSSRAQRMNFYNDYVFPVTITKLEFPGSSQDWKNRYDVENIKVENSNDVDFGYKVVAKFDFVNCFVTRIGEISLSSDGFDQALTFDVTINFETYEYVPFDQYNVQLADD